MDRETLEGLLLAEEAGEFPDIDLSFFSDR